MKWSVLSHVGLFYVLATCRRKKFVFRKSGIRPKSPEATVKTTADYWWVALGPRALSLTRAFDCLDFLNVSLYQIQ